jgi:hypothetical protein
MSEWEHEPEQIGLTYVGPQLLERLPDVINFLDMRSMHNFILDKAYSSSKCAHACYMDFMLIFSMYVRMCGFMLNMYAWMCGCMFSNVLNLCLVCIVYACSVCVYASCGFLCIDTWYYVLSVLCMCMCLMFVYMIIISWSFIYWCLILGKLGNIMSLQGCDYLYKLQIELITYRSCHDLI